ncbi:hypothetical protein PV326_004980 [Microctonus aethiopoides]|nr:hypothetical protein PV326_004980 [Microctonus aethiopoides]
MRKIKSESDNKSVLKFEDRGSLEDLCLSDSAILKSLNPGGGFAEDAESLRREERGHPNWGETEGIGEGASSLWIMEDSELGNDGLMEESDSCVEEQSRLKDVDGNSLELMFVSLLESKFGAD